MNINESGTVKKQYENADKLNTRISIHEKYSTNKTGFGNWIFSHYRIESGASILELGCGTGEMWLNKGAEIDRCGRLILSDFSDGMLNTARNNLREYNKIEYQVIDIQDIPFEDSSFDIVIANMMLYHVPDIQRGLSEARRVMKDNGVFYCATYGEHGIMEYLSSLLGEYGVEDNANKSFTLQNGEAILSHCFGNVSRLEYADSLAVTDVDDMVDYIYSLAGMSALSTIPREQVRQILLRHTADGVLNVPKEYGMFICGK